LPTMLDCVGVEVVMPMSFDALVADVEVDVLLPILFTQKYRINCCIRPNLVTQFST